MFQFTYKLKVAERIKAKCERHPHYNLEREGRGGIKGGCSTCYSLFALHQGKALARRRSPGVSPKSLALDAGPRNSDHTTGASAGSTTPARNKLLSPESCERGPLF